MVVIIISDQYISHSVCRYSMVLHVYLLSYNNSYLLVYILCVAIWDVLSKN